MPATTTPSAEIQVEHPPAPWEDRVDFLLWQPPEAAQARTHEVAPDANVDLLLEVSDSQCRAWLYGPVTRLARMRTRGDCGYYVVHFHPGAMPRWVDASPAELVDAAVELHQLGGLSVDVLGEQLNQAGSSAQRLEIVGGVLQRAPWPPLDTFDRAWRHLRAQGDIPGVAELSDALHLSPRTLERAFRERLGLAPRTFRRILRLQRALACMRSEPERSLAEIALASGYADHAHLTREFQALMGRTPSEFRAEG